MNRRITKLGLAALAAVVVVAGVGVVTAQAPPPAGSTVTAPVVLPAQMPRPTAAQRPTQVTPPILQPSPQPRSPSERRESGNWTPGTTTNVRFEATVIDQTGTATPTRKTISVTIADGGSASVRSGVTVPVVSTTYVPLQKEGERTQPYQSYNYRDMGLSLDVRNVYVDGNYVRASWSVEYNPVDEKVADSPASGALMPGAPSFASFKQSLVLALETGKQLVVSQSSDPVPARDRKMTLEVKATILK